MSCSLAQPSPYMCTCSRSSFLPCLKRVELSRLRRLSVPLATAMALATPWRDAGREVVDGARAASPGCCRLHTRQRRSTARLPGRGPPVARMHGLTHVSCVAAPSSCSGHKHHAKRARGAGCRTLRGITICFNYGFPSRSAYVSASGFLFPSPSAKLRFSLSLSLSLSLPFSPSLSRSPSCAPSHFLSLSPSR